MPKIKTHSGAKKRFRKTATGKIMREKAGMNHELGKKGSSRKRRLSNPGQVSKADKKKIEDLLGK